MAQRRLSSFVRERFLKEDSELDSVSMCVEESESNERSKLRLEDVSELGQWVLRLMEVKRD